MHSVVDENGRERFADSERGAALVAGARRDLAAAQAALDDSALSKADLGRALQRLSEYLRFAGELEDAARLKREAIAVWEELGRKRAAFLVRLQLALVEREQGASLDVFEPLRAELADDPDLAPYESTLNDFASRIPAGGL